MAEVRSVSSTGGQKGVKTERHDLIPIGPLRELAEHYGRGARKYEDHQWRAGYEWSKSYSAIQRHLAAFWAGEDYDVCPLTRDGCVPFPGEDEIPEGRRYCYNHTGSHHMACVAWHSFTLLEFKDRFPNFDDRYIPVRSKQDEEKYKQAYQDSMAQNNLAMAEAIRLGAPYLHR